MTKKKNLLKGEITWLEWRRKKRRRGWLVWGKKNDVSKNNE